MPNLIPTATPYFQTSILKNPTQSSHCPQAANPLNLPHRFTFYPTAAPVIAPAAARQRHCAAANL
ncbi:MAG: hypothetical protein Q4A84_02295 [Neisseria sp.]|uniref:hypothetical protein n=1 Tax=Neisseria sp. TaxID=192066 RepID=UPI0026DD0299|nr:hypothetical protein [Neisseria sp.]MDO4640522.1 hypothetical protein [Neisseria sp.]